MYARTRSFAARCLRSKPTSKSVGTLLFKRKLFHEETGPHAKRAKIGPPEEKPSIQPLQPLQVCPQLYSPNCTTLLDLIDKYKNTYFIKSWKKKNHDMHIIQAHLFHSQEKDIQVSVNGNLKTIPKMSKMWKVRAINTSQSYSIEEHLVDYEDYNRIVKTTDKFTSDHVYLSPDKWKRNWSFISHIKCQQELNPKTERRVVYLDAPAALTTNMLVSSGLYSSPHQLQVPNVNPEFLSQAQKNFSSLATCHHRSFFEWLRDLPTRDIQDGFDVGADYCSTFSGNRHMKPKVDLALMFRRSILARKGGVLWLTFCVRPFTVKSVYKAVAQWISFEAKKNNYTLKLLEKGDYNGMVYYMFVTV